MWRETERLAQFLSLYPRSQFENLNRRSATEILHTKAQQYGTQALEPASVVKSVQRSHGCSSIILRTKHTDVITSRRVGRAALADEI
jgi:hypothetical protein